MLYTPHVQRYKQYSSFLRQQFIWRRPSYRLADSFGPTVDDVAAQGVCRSPPTARSTGLLPAPAPDLAAEHFPLKEDRRGGGPQEGADEFPSTSTQSLLLSISATLPSTSAACSFCDIPPMRLSCNDMRNPSKLGAPTRRLFITCSLTSTKCHSRIPPSYFNSVRAVKSRKASWDRFIPAYPHHRESTTKMLCTPRYFYRLFQRVCCTSLCTGDSTAVSVVETDLTRFVGWLS